MPGTSLQAQKTQDTRTAAQVGNRIIGRQDFAYGRLKALKPDGIGYVTEMLFQHELLPPFRDWVAIRPKLTKPCFNQRQAIVDGGPNNWKNWDRPDYCRTTP
jgi:hypothetical protein